jgi:hypothetical protein
VPKRGRVAYCTELTRPPSLPLPSASGMSAVGTFRTSHPCQVMSAYEGEAEVFEKHRHFRY